MESVIQSLGSEPALQKEIAELETEYALVGEEVEQVWTIWNATLRLKYPVKFLTLHESGFECNVSRPTFDYTFQLTMESLRRKEMFQKSQAALDVLEKEVKILKNRREAQKVRFRKRLQQLEKLKEEKD
jgi:hypothetical protein